MIGVGERHPIRRDRADVRLIAFARFGVEAERMVRANDLIAGEHPIGERAAFVRAKRIGGEDLTRPRTEHRDWRFAHLKRPPKAHGQVVDLA